MGFNDGDTQKDEAYENGDSCQETKWSPVDQGLQGS